MKRLLDPLTLLLVVCMTALAIWGWFQLPDRIPTHIALDGTPDAWSDRNAAFWFAIPGIAIAVTLFMAFLRSFLPRHPRWVNLQPRTRLSDLPEAARPPITDALADFLALTQLEILLIFGLIQVATLRTAMGHESQAIMIGVLVLAILTTPTLLAVLLLRLRPAFQRGKELARRAAQEDAVDKRSW